MKLTSLLSAAAPWRVRELQRLDTIVRERHPLSIRLGVVGVAGGMGTSVAAGLTAAVLAARGGSRVLAVNASGDRRSLLWHTGLARSIPTVSEVDEQRRDADRFEQVVEELPRTSSGVYCMELGIGGEQRWWRAAAPITRFFDHVITDWGVRNVAQLGTVVASSTLVCIVAHEERSAIQQAVDLSGAVYYAGARPMICICDTRGANSPAIDQLCALLPCPAVRFAYDPAHGQALPVPSSALRHSTRVSALRMAAMTVQSAGNSAAVEGTRS